MTTNNLSQQRRGRRYDLRFKIVKLNTQPNSSVPSLIEQELQDLIILQKGEADKKSVHKHSLRQIFRKPEKTESLISSIQNMEALSHIQSYFKTEPCQAEAVVKLRTQPDDPLLNKVEQKSACAIDIINTFIRKPVKESSNNLSSNIKTNQKNNVSKHISTSSMNNKNSGPVDALQNIVHQQLKKTKNNQVLASQTTHKPKEIVDLKSINSSLNWSTAKFLQRKLLVQSLSRRVDFLIRPYNKKIVRHNSQQKQKVLLQLLRV